MIYTAAETEDYRITRLAFLDRFTEDEYAALDLMSIDDPSADMPTRTAKAKLRLYLEKVRAATFIDLARDDTRDGVEALVPLGVITMSRASEILNNLIVDSERP